MRAGARPVNASSMNTPSMRVPRNSSTGEITSVLSARSTARRVVPVMSLASETAATSDRSLRMKVRPQNDPAQPEGLSRANVSSLLDLRLCPVLPCLHG